MKSFLNKLLKLGWQGSKKADPWDHSQCQGSFLKIANREAPELDIQNVRYRIGEPEAFFLRRIKESLSLCLDVNMIFRFW